MWLRAEDARVKLNAVKSGDLFISNNQLFRIGLNQTTDLVTALKWLKGPTFKLGG